MKRQNTDSKVILKHEYGRVEIKMNGSTGDILSSIALMLHEVYVENPTVGKALKELFLDDKVLEEMVFVSDEEINRKAMEVIKEMEAVEEVMPDLEELAGELEELAGELENLLGMLKARGEDA